MARARRNMSYKLTGIHDRRSRDLPINAELAEVEVDNPLAVDPDEKIVAIRSIRNDPLGRLHAHRQIDEAQYRGGRAYQNDWERAERGPQAMDPPANMSTARAPASLSPRASVRPCCG